jgi:glutamine amidotransferase
MKKVVIVDYGLGNLYSIEQACIHVGYKPLVSGNKDDIISADRLILPGVGAFGVAMQSLNDTGLLQPIKEYAQSGRPLMGICLGMQLLFDSSQEFGHHDGLGLIEGTVVRFPSEVNGKKLRIPNIGWHKVYSPSSWDNTPLTEVDQASNHMYFIHSYYAQPKNPENILALSKYDGFEYTSAAVKNNIWGFQFHPEKSGEEGLSIYKNFLAI